MMTDWFAFTGIHDPCSPSGHWTRTWASPAGPSPKWIQPELPPNVAAADSQLASHRHVADPDLDPGPDGVAVRIRAARSVTASQWPMGAGFAASPAPTFRQSITGRPEVHLDQVEQPVEVEVGQGGSAPPLEVEDPGGCRRPP